MLVVVRIPTPLRRFTGERESVQVSGAASVRALIEELERAHPGLKQRICGEGDELRRFVNIFVGEDDIRFLQGLDTALKDGDEISIVPAIAGGL